MNLLVTSLLLCFQYLTVVKGDPDQTRLFADLFKRSEYNSLIPPARENLNVTFGLAILHTEYNPSINLLSVMAWERYQWKDYRLAWDPNEYGNVRILRLPQDRLWTPDIKLYNQYWNSYHRDDVLLIVYSDGTVMWIAPTQFRIKCFEKSENGQKNNDDKPDDDDLIECRIKYGSWTYDGFSMNLSEEEQGLDFSSFQSTGDIDIDSSYAKVTSSYYPCCVEPYMDYTAHLKIKP